MAGCDINSVYAGIAGNHIRSLNSHGIVAIQDNEVSSSDVDRVIDAARAVAIPADQKILHILPQEFIIDSQEGILDPTGMSGIRMEAKVHMVTGAESAAQNIIKCIERCDLEVDDIVLEQLASSYSVLTDDEKAKASFKLFNEYIAKETLATEINLVEKKATTKLLDFKLDTIIEKI